MARSIAHKLRTAALMGPRRQLLVVEACASMFIARMSLAIFPFSRLAKGFGAFVPPTDPRVLAQAEGAAEEQVRTARAIGWAVRSSAPYMPFKTVCLQQAMAAHAMLRRRGIASVMHFGAGKSDDKPIDAHAWLDAVGVKVTGYPVAANFSELGCFV
ncbi:MAG: hypothetical protein JWN66_4390 [Sphingomonas bacterium]|uniref:lasso peptide biosynthesis B2 protein n=1 Tax=Sphingomonas bacterium TaxID=1895847 RepID=UPI00262DB8CA|nr:lasso peptide biosynthesis B2 protein [Sphingomonas bacterium]MDB5707274.1 hypothetical protein [Sphingomonas bacterium]